MWKNEAKFEDMMYLSNWVTGVQDGLFTALNNKNLNHCDGTDCNEKLVRVTYTCTDTLVHVAEMSLFHLLNF